MQSGLGEFGRSIAIALQPAPARFAVGAALRTLLVAGAIALAGATFGDLDSVGLAYFGAACAVAFARESTYRGIVTALFAQCVGAIAGLLAAASTPADPAALVVTATVAGIISGAAGSLHPAAPGFGMMLSIGLAFGQFSATPLPLWSQCIWYGIGTLAVAVVWLWPWVFRRGVAERDIAADVFVAAADLCEALGGPDANHARARLATASAAARTAARDTRAELVAFAAAVLYAEAAAVPAPAILAVRTVAQRVRDGRPPTIELDLEPATPGLGPQRPPWRCTARATRSGCRSPSPSSFGPSMRRSSFAR